MVATGARAGFARAAMADPNFGARIGERVRTRREALGWSQAKLAEIAGISPNYVGVVERGEKLPTLDTLDAMANALSVPPGALLASDAPDKWADEISALARGIPPLHRRLVIALLKAIAAEPRDPRPRRTKATTTRARR
jgi:transcriptional regulator with XRE-family HTH domain